MAKFSIVLLVNDNIMLNKITIKKLIERSCKQDAELFIVCTTQNNYVKQNIERIEPSDYLIIKKIFCETDCGVNGRNLVIDKCSGRYIVFVDNDVIVMPGWLVKLERYFSLAEVGCVGCEGWYFKVVDKNFLLNKNINLKRGSFVDVVSSSLCMFKNTGMNKFLILPETFGIYGADDLYYSLSIKMNEYRCCYAGWNNIGIHLGQRKRRRQEEVSALQHNSKIINQMFVENNLYRKLKLEKAFIEYGEVE